jgi:hypothetical protein
MRPSSGVKPIVVSTEMPPETAASDAPAPRCAVTVRSSVSGRPSSSAARCDAYAWESPWNPYRRSGHFSRHSRGIAYVDAAGGSVAWNAVSKQATWGTSGSASRTMSTAASDRG